jgi:hypothetical protein
MKTIGIYRVTEWGNERLYIEDEAEAKIMRSLTGRKSIDGQTMELIRDLTAGFIRFEMVPTPERRD